MKNKKAENPREDIIKFAEEAHWWVSKAFIVFIVLCVIQLLAALIGLIFGGFEFAGHVLELGGITIHLPAMSFEGISEGVRNVLSFGGIISITDDFGLFGILTLARTIVLLMLLHYAKEMFVQLKEKGTPFCDEVLDGLKYIGVMMFIIGGLSGLAALVLAGFAWLFYVIFQYGKKLQEESDTTL